jgi:type IV secretory pathway component VirB8
MAEEHHHHHHHHKMDGASKFKRKSLLAIERRKKIIKWLFRILCGIAVIMALLVVAVYTIG